MNFHDMPPWLQDMLRPFDLRAIMLNDPQERKRAIGHMDRVFGLHDAFLDYLVLQGPPEVRAKARELLYEMDLKGFIDPYSTAFQAGDGNAAAWWTPPWANKLNLWETIKLVPIGMRVVGWPRTFEGFGILGKLEKARPNEPHWYLNNLAVAQEIQGQRYGSALLIQILWFADRGEHPCFLMIANPDNERFYARFGFQMVEEGKQPNFGPKAPFYKAMIRMPNAHVLTPDSVARFLAH